MRNRTRKITVIVIISIICISLIGTSFVAIFLPGPAPAENDSQQAWMQAFDQIKQQVELLKEKHQANPDDWEIQLELGNAYYYKASYSYQINIDEFKEDLSQAIAMYRRVLEKEDNNNARLMLAACAYKLGDADLAGQTYEEALQKEPENPEALYGYGLYLLSLKDDPKQAVQYWEKALPLVKEEEFRQQLEEMIKLAKGMDSNQASEDNN